MSFILEYTAILI